MVGMLMASEPKMYDMAEPKLYVDDAQSDHPSHVADTTVLRPVPEVWWERPIASQKGNSEPFTTRIVTCQYCSKPADLVLGWRLYPRRPELRRKRYWYCESCNAWVGCRSGTMRPLGTLANTTLRALRRTCHGMLDPVWKGKVMYRHAAYAELARDMGIPLEQCHFALFGPEQCRQAIEVLHSDKWRKLRPSMFRGIGG